MPATATAFPHRDYANGVVIASVWDDPAEDTANIAWARHLTDALQPFATGGLYVNEAEEDEATAAFGVNLERLRQIKARYDPANVFRHNTDITPA